MNKKKLNFCINWNLFVATLIHIHIECLEFIACILQENSSSIYYISHYISTLTKIVLFFIQNVSYWSNTNQVNVLTMTESVIMTVKNYFFDTSGSSFS